MPVHIFGNNNPRTRVFAKIGVVIHTDRMYWKPVWKHMWFESGMREEIRFRDANWAGAPVRFVKLGNHESLLVRTSNGWFELEAYSFCS